MIVGKQFGVIDFRVVMTLCYFLYEDDGFENLINLSATVLHNSRRIYEEQW